MSTARFPIAVGVVCAAVLCVGIAGAGGRRSDRDGRRRQPVAVGARGADR
ncbi:hypothetical protein AB0467_06170 [Streptomyces sp. NPDC052095]